jgi:hypothetical protein
MINFKSASVVLASLIFALPASASTWDSNPKINNYTFNKFIGNTYVHSVQVKVGFVDGGEPNTEVTVTYTPATCSAFTATGFKVKINDDFDGIPVRVNVGKSTYYGNKTTVTGSVDYRVFEAGDMFLEVTAECEGTNAYDYVVEESFEVFEETVETVEENVEFDSTSNCDSHWLDTDCWGY